MSALVPEAFGHDPSNTSVFAALPEIELESGSSRPLRAVIIGGGTGASMSIRTVLSMGIDTSAVVAMADDGGSTGILRNQAGATTPGDVRKCLTAMAQDPEDPLVKAFKVRFGFAENHSLGNLILSALEVTGDGFPEAIQICEKLLNTRGHVYPSTLNRVSLISKTRDGRTLEGQAVASHSRTALKKVALRSSDDVVAYEPALNAIRQADLIVLGPGSLYTSIIPNLLVPGIVQAIQESQSTVVFICSIADIQGETRGLSVLEHYDALCSHGMAGLVDYMLVQDDDIPVNDETIMIRYLFATDEDRDHIESLGTRLITCDFVGPDYPTWHDPAKLRQALTEVLSGCHSIQR